jgi:hypothetical protein
MLDNIKKKISRDITISKLMKSLFVNTDFTQNSFNLIKDNDSCKAGSVETSRGAP